MRSLNRLAAGVILVGSSQFDERTLKGVDDDDDDDKPGAKR
jgi:hypothetical protein